MGSFNRCAIELINSWPSMLLASTNARHDDISIGGDGQGFPCVRDSNPRESVIPQELRIHAARLRPARTSKLTSAGRIRS